MKPIHGKVEGDTVVDVDTRLDGMIVGNVRVTHDATLHLNGMVVGKLEVEPLSRVLLRGTVNGDVMNRGGHLEVWGKVSGHLIRESGVTIVHPNAAVSE